MSQIESYAPVKNMRGEFEKNSGIVMRKKKYRAPNGSVLREGVQESYKIAHPRDFEKTPPKGAERANMQSFGDISRLTTEIIRSERYTQEALAAMTPEERTRVAELCAQLEQYRTRFYAQFKRPDPEAPFQKKLEPGCTTLKRKQYSKIDTFIQALIREKHKNHLQKPRGRLRI